jgi:hypothetical protein
MAAYIKTAGLHHTTGAAMRFDGRPFFKEGGPSWRRFRVAESGSQSNIETKHNIGMGLCLRCPEAGAGDYAAAVAEVDGWQQLSRVSQNRAAAQAREPFDPHGIATLHAADERFQQEARMPRRDREPLCRALQLVPRP